MTDKDNKNYFGVVKINDEVIASIARKAALQVAGVERVKSSMFSMLMELFSKEYHKNGITLDINDNNVTIGITIVVRYGVTIPDISSLVQDNIRSAIEEMTGLSVAEVNVSIADIYSEESEN